MANDLHLYTYGANPYMFPLGDTVIYIHIGKPPAEILDVQPPEVTPAPRTAEAPVVEEPVDFKYEPLQFEPPQPQALRSLDSLLADDRPHDLLYRVLPETLAGSVGAVLERLDAAAGDVSLHMVTGTQGFE